MFRCKEGELVDEQTRMTMMACLRAELELGKPLTQLEVEELYASQIATVRTIGRPLKSSIAIIIICLLGSWLGIFFIAQIASWVKGG